VSYARARLFPIRNERTLEHFFINRFGKELYETFFKQYTEKVWGVPCSSIKPEWGAQRIKGLSVSRVIAHAVLSLVARDRSVEQRKTETSLIERFYYPKYGPGQMWETAAEEVLRGGGELRFNTRVIGLESRDNTILSAVVEHVDTGETGTVEADYFFSSMPLRALIRSLGESVPDAVREVAGGLQYRHFCIVGLLLERSGAAPQKLSAIHGDNWIYVQEPDVKLGRIQIFNN
jgi:protoporphyrinogen oxidase